MWHQGYEMLPSCRLLKPPGSGEKVPNKSPYQWVREEFDDGAGAATPPAVTRSLLQQLTQASNGA